MKVDTVSKLMIHDVDDLARQHIIRMMKRSVLVLVMLFTMIVLLNERHRIIQVFDHSIEKISLEGNFQHLDSESTKEYVSRYIGSGFLMTDLEEVKQYIESLPWVYQARVSRVWPGEISVVIQEQVPVSYWNQEGLINAEGQLFVPEKLDLSIGLPVIELKTEVSDSERLEMFLLLNYIQNELSVFKLKIVKLTQNLRGALEITLSNGIAITLGRIDIDDDHHRFLDDKLERVGRLLVGKNAISFDNVERLDTRYPNGIAVQWKENTK